MPDLYSMPHESQAAALWRELADTRRELAELRAAYERLHVTMDRLLATVRDRAQVFLDMASYFAAEQHKRRLAAPGGIQPAPESPKGPEAATGQPEPLEGEPN